MGLNQNEVDYAGGSGRTEIAIRNSGSWVGALAGWCRPLPSQMPLADIPLAWNSSDSATFPSFSTMAVTSSTHLISSSENPITVIALFGRKQKSSEAELAVLPFSKLEPGLRGQAKGLGLLSAGHPPEQP